jgi:hypothetical protein
LSAGTKDVWCGMPASKIINVYNSAGTLIN